MMKKMYLKQFITLCVFAISFSTTGQIIVDNSIGSNAQYDNLQTAINEAPNNSTIYVHASAIRYGDITIEKPITLVGRSHSEPSFKSTINNITITHNGSGTDLRGLDMNNITFQGLNGSRSSSGVITSPVLVQNIAIEQCSFNNLIPNRLLYYNSSGGFSYGVGSNNILVRGCFVNFINQAYTTNLNISQNFIRSQINITRPDSTIITNNIFNTTSATVYNNGSNIGKVLVQNSIFIVNNGSPQELSIPNSQLDNCLTYNYGTGSYSLAADANDIGMVTNNMLINTNPMFTIIDTSNPSDLFNIESDYTLATGSPAIGSGFNGEDMGVFGNSYTFSNVGNPSGFPTINITSSTAAVPENGTLSITISAKAN